MTTRQTDRSVSRRAALAGLGAGGLGLALAATARHATAQDAAAEMANHPLVGTWLLGTGPTDFGVVHWDEDGNMTYNGFIAPSATDSTAIHTNPRSWASGSRTASAGSTSPSWR